MSKPKTNRAVTEPEAIHVLPFDKCLVSERNTRQPTVKEVTASGLVQSLKETGQTTPGIVRPHPTKKGFFEIAAGSRRRTAAEAAGREGFKAVIRPMDDQEFDALVLVENFQRVDPDPKAEAVVVQRLTEAGKTPKEISAVLGRPESWALRRVRLLQVIPALLKSWSTGADISRKVSRSIDHFTVEMMELIGSLPKTSQDALLNDWAFGQANSYKELSGHLKREVLCSLDVPWLEDPDTFVKDCGPGCAHDSRKQGQLFDKETHGKCGTCLNSACFFARQAKAQAKEHSAIDGGENLPMVTTSYNVPVIQTKDGTVKVNQLESWKFDVLSEAAVKKDPKLAAQVKKVILCEEGVMKVGYLKAKASGNGSGTATKLASPKEKAKAKVDMLQAKRWVLVLEKLKKTLKETTWRTVSNSNGTVEVTKALDGTDLIDLVTVFGLPWKTEAAPGGVNDEWKQLDEWKFWSREELHYSRHATKKPAAVDRLEALWQGVKELLERNFKHPKVTDILAVVPHMERVAKLIAFPITEHKRQADLAVLPPKSWGAVDPHTLQPKDEGGRMKDEGKKAPGKKPKAK